jgi:predicted AlkP superfamily pyrophosphatase or phosphodiesterase
LRPYLQLKWFSVNCGYANCHLLRLLSTQKNTITFFSLLFSSFQFLRLKLCIVWCFLSDHWHLFLFYSVFRFLLIKLSCHFIFLSDYQSIHLILCGLGTWTYNFESQKMDEMIQFHFGLLNSFLDLSIFYLFMPGGINQHKCPPRSASRVKITLYIIQLVWKWHFLFTFYGH